MRKFIFAMCWLFMMFPMSVWAQRNEVSVTAGGGGLASDGQSISIPVATLAYTRSLTDHLAVEGALELFWIEGDDFIDSPVAVVYHFRSQSETHRAIPYATAGVGKTSTDPTEIPSQWVIRLGGGIKYFFWERLGVRLEARDEIIRTGETPYYPLPGSPQHLLSGRVGVIYRF